MKQDACASGELKPEDARASGQLKPKVITFDSSGDALVQQDRQGEAQVAVTKLPFGVREVGYDACMKSMMMHAMELAFAMVPKLDEKDVNVHGHCEGSKVPKNIEVEAVRNFAEGELIIVPAVKGPEFVASRVLTPTAVRLGLANISGEHFSLLPSVSWVAKERFLTLLWLVPRKSTAPHNLRLRSMKVTVCAKGALDGPLREAGLPASKISQTYTTVDVPVLVNNKPLQSGEKLVLYWEPNKAKAPTKQPKTWLDEAKKAKESAHHK